VVGSRSHVLLFELPELRLKFFKFLLYSCGGFSVMLISCSIKCAEDSELSYLSDFGCRNLTCDFIFINLRLTISVLRVNTFSIST
jgi:hypothetical protein